MAVPKQKQSHARTAQRRAQHKITAPAVNDCPQCRPPRRPHRVCPHCGFYGGREVVHMHDATITITSTSSTPVTVAVDVNGADLGPAEVARGAAHAEACA